MQKVFEASGYQFTIITPNDSEPHFIAKEISEALGYSKSFSLSQYFRDKLTVTKENGLPGIKKMLGGIHQRTSRLALLTASSLQEYLLRHSTRPKAKDNWQMSQSLGFISGIIGNKTISNSTCPKERFQ